MKTKYIHYGTAEFLKEVFEPIKNRPSFCKPTGGLWASPIDSEYGWRDWCKDEQYMDCDDLNSFTFELQDNAKVYVIDSLKDLLLVPHKVNDDSAFGSVQVIDFEKMAMEYDAIFLTCNGQWKTRYSKFEGYIMDLYGWDCESILVMNPGVVKVCKPEKLYQ